MKLAQIKRLFNAYFSSCSGSYSVIFALAFSVVIMASGGMLDVIRQHQASLDVQRRADVAAMSMARGKTNQATKNLSEYMARFGPTETVIDSVTTNRQLVGAEATGEATVMAHLKPRFLGMFGMNVLPVNRKAIARLTYDSYEYTPRITAIKGIYAKDFYIYVLSADGTISQMNRIFIYRWTGTTGTMSYDPLRSLVVMEGDTVRFMMSAYKDDSFRGQLINRRDFYSHTTAGARQVRITGDCKTGTPETHKWEDGGDYDYLDVVYSLSCRRLTTASNMRITN